VPLYLLWPSLSDESAFGGVAWMLFLLQVAASGAVKKLNVEGGVAAKARAVYAALFVPAQAPESNGSSSPKSPGSPKANGSSDAAANGTSSSTKLAPAVVAAVPLLQQLASDPPGQLAQLVALEWLLTVSCQADC
jgi:hypothetical protein